MHWESPSEMGGWHMRTLLCKSQGGFSCSPAHKLLGVTARMQPPLPGPLVREDALALASASKGAVTLKGGVRRRSPTSSDSASFLCKGPPQKSHTFLLLLLYQNLGHMVTLNKTGSGTKGGDNGHLVATTMPVPPLFIYTSQHPALGVTEDLKWIPGSILDPHPSLGF